jgi:hypothetical protein
MHAFLVGKCRNEHGAMNMVGWVGWMVIISEPHISLVINQRCIPLCWAVRDEAVVPGKGRGVLGGGQRTCTTRALGLGGTWTCLEGDVHSIMHSSCQQLTPSLSHLAPFLQQCGPTPCPTAGCLLGPGPRASPSPLPLPHSTPSPLPCRPPLAVPFPHVPFHAPYQHIPLKHPHNCSLTSTQQAIAT